MSSTMPWFRMYSDILGDKKIKRIHAATGKPRALIVGVWTAMMAMANDSCERGTLLISESIPVSLDDISEETDVDLETLKEMMGYFKELEMVNGNGAMVIKNWQKRQFKSDNSTERSRRAREKDAPIIEPEPVKIEKKKPVEKKKEPVIDADGLPHWVPEVLRENCKVFSETSNIPVPEKTDGDWVKSLWELNKLGASPEVIIKSVKKLKGSGMTVIRPGAIVRTVTGFIANVQKVTRLDADGVEITEEI